MNRKVVRIVAFTILGFSFACLATLGLSLLSPEGRTFFALTQSMSWLKEVALLGALGGAALGVILSD